MATIRKIKNSKKGAYQIIVSNGYDSNNKQIRVTTTFTPDKTKSQRQLNNPGSVSLLSGLRKP